MLTALINQARTAAKAKDLGKAARLLQEAMQLAPEDARLAFAAATAALKAGRPEAFDQFPDLLKRFPDHAGGWENLGRTLAEMGRVEAACVCLRRAAAVAPSARLALTCGRLLRQLGRFAEARAALVEACRLDERCAPAHFLLGVMAQDAGERQAAAGSYRTALDIDPDLVEAAVNLGTVLQENGELEEAKRAYASAVRRRADTFGRVAQALTTSPRGELWLDLGRLRRTLSG